MSYRGGPVNWDLAKNVARHAVAAAGDPSVLASQRNEVVEAVRLADLWLEDVSTFPSGIQTVQAWSRSEWVEATFPVWSKLCEPIAATVVEGMSSMLSVDPSQLEGVPEELKSAFGAFGGGGRPGRARRDDEAGRRGDDRRPDRGGRGGAGR